MCVTLDGTRFAVMEPVWRAFAAMTPGRRLFNFDYAIFSHTFKRGKNMDTKKGATPYQTRHSSASMDLANYSAGSDGVQRRRQRKSLKSMAHFGERARLSTAFATFPSYVQPHALECEAHIEAIVLQDKLVPVLGTA